MENVHTCSEPAGRERARVRRLHGQQALDPVHDALAVERARRDRRDRRDARACPSVHHESDS